MSAHGDCLSAISWVVRVLVAETGGFEHDEGKTGRDQDATDDRVLSALDRGPERESDEHDHGTENHRHEHVRNAGERRQARDLTQG